jgi:hypothetical protein
MRLWRSVTASSRSPRRPARQSRWRQCASQVAGETCVVIAGIMRAGADVDDRGSAYGRDTERSSACACAPPARALPASR